MCISIQTEIRRRLSESVVVESSSVLMWKLLVNDDGDAVFPSILTKVFFCFFCSIQWEQSGAAMQTTFDSPLFQLCSSHQSRYWNNPDITSDFCPSAEHEGPVTVVGVSVDGLNMLAGTSSGNLGYLDISTRNYTTVMRSHTGRVLCMSVDPVRRQMATVSQDHTIRLWDLDSLQQVSKKAGNPQR